MTEQYEFFPDSVRQKLPALYSTENEPDPLMVVKFFTPDMIGRFMQVSSMARTFSSVGSMA